MKILFTTTRFPYPPLRGDKAIPYNRIRCLGERHEVSLLSFVESERELSFVGKLEPYCAEIRTVMLPKWRSALNMVSKALSTVPLQVSYYDSAEYGRELTSMLSARRYDLVHAVLSRGAAYVLPLDQPVRVVEMIDTLSLNMSRRSQSSKGPARYLYQWEALRMSRYEERICREADHVIVVSEADRDALPGNKISVIPVGVDAVMRPRKTNGRTVVFSGNMGYYPNEDAALFIVREIMPLLRKAVPGVLLRLIGMNPPARLRSAAAGQNDIEITGWVESVMNELLTADVAICPLRTGGAGMHLKVLEALACGVPTIISPMVTGFAATPGKDLLVSEGAQGFTDAVHSVLSDQGLAERLGKNGQALVRERYSWEATSRQLEELYGRICSGIGSFEDKGCVIEVPENDRLNV